MPHLSLNTSKVAGFLLAAGLAVAASASASEPARFDQSTEQTARASARAVTEQLPADRQELFKAALIKLASVGGPVTYTLADGRQRVGFPPERIEAILDGRTAEEIITLAEETPTPVDSVRFDDSKRQRSLPDDAAR